MHLSTSIIRGMCLIIALTFSYSAQALKADRKQPIKVEADKANIEKQSGISTYSGHVVIRQGSLIITADKLKLYTKNGKLERMVANGKPATFNQRGAQGKNVRANANKITFHMKRNVAIFEGKANLMQGDNTFNSNRIIYNANTNSVDAGKSSGGGRVIITISPDSNNDKSGAQDKPKP